MQTTKIILLLSIFSQFSFAAVTTKPTRKWRLFPRRRGMFGLCGGEAQTKNRILPIDFEMDDENNKKSSKLEENTSRIESDRTVKNLPKQAPNLISKLPNDIFMEVNKFLETKSILNLRICGKSLLSKQTEVLNTKLIMQLKPQIKTGFEILERHSFASLSLLNLKEPLKDLLNADYIKEKYKNSIVCCNQKEINNLLDLLKTVDDFECFIILALMFYNYVHQEACWRLIEATLKAEIFDIKDFIEVQNFDYPTAFLTACQMGLSTLGKTMLDSYNENLDYFEGCMKCINNGYLNLFRYTLKTSIKTCLISESNLIALLEHSFSLNKPIFAQILFEMFPKLSYVPTISIFHAINNKNLTSLKLILDNRQYSDINVKDSDGFKPFEKAAMIDFHEGIKLLVNNLINPNLNMLLRAISTAVSYESLQSVRELFSAFDSYGRESIVLYRHYFMSFIKISIEKQNVELLRLVLDHTPKNLFEKQDDNNWYFSTFRRLQDHYFDPIKKTIKLNFISGFSMLVEHFGTDILKIRDKQNRSPFLISALHGNYQIALEIAKIDPKQIHSVDKNGDNALHLALNNLENPFEFIKSILHLNINWEQKNKENEAPIEILDSIQMSPTDIEILYFYFASKS